jgi:AraC-like DNA-binding protein
VIDERCMQEAWLRGLHTAWRQHGLDADRLFAQADIQVAHSHELDPLVLSDRLSMLWELAVHVTGDPLIGLRTAPKQPAGSLGPIAHLVLACPTMLEALQRLCNYVDLIMPTTTARVERRPEVVRVILHLSAGRRPVPPQRYDYVAGLTLHLMEWMVGTAICPVLTCLSFDPPADSRSYESLYRSPVRFGQTQCTMDFRAADLQVRLPTANAMVAEWCNRLASDMVETRKGRVSMRVKKLLLEMLSKGDPRRDVVAEQLRLSERTLQRRLSEEGTNFQELVDQTRRELAHQYLSIGRLTPKEMSFELGFSDPSNFYRACKRWFGRSPREFRASMG